MHKYKEIRTENDILRNSVEDPGVIRINGLTKIFYCSEDFDFSENYFDCIIHLESVDTIQISNGELFPYAMNPNTIFNELDLYPENRIWIYEIFNSDLYKFRKEYLEKCYKIDSFDKCHYFFEFHDYFIEAISPPFEIEKTMGFYIYDYLQKESKQPDKIISPNPLEECHFYEYQNYQIPEISNSDYFHKLYKCIYKPKFDTRSKTYSCYLKKIDNNIYSLIEPRPLGMKSKTFSGVLSFSEFVDYVLSISLNFNDVDFSGT